MRPEQNLWLGVGSLHVAHMSAPCLFRDSIHPCVSPVHAVPELQLTTPVRRFRCGVPHASADRGRRNGQETSGGSRPPSGLWPCAVLGDRTDRLRGCCTYRSVWVRPGSTTFDRRHPKSLSFFPCGKGAPGRRARLSDHRRPSVSLAIVLDSSRTGRKLHGWVRRGVLRLPLVRGSERSSGVQSRTASCRDQNGAPANLGPPSDRPA